MSGRAAAARPSGPRHPRRLLSALGALLGVAVVVPPLLGLAHGHEYADALQFAVLALCCPALLVLGAPWGDRPLRGPVRWVASGDAGGAQTIAITVAQVALLVVWRLPPVIDAVERAPWLLAVEATTLVAAGLAMWLLLVDSPPVVARERPLHRLVLAAVCMWTVWIVAYVEDMAGGQWASTFHHVAGVGLSAAADRELATTVMFVAAAAAFLPVVSYNLIVWLGQEERRGAAGIERHESAHDALRLPLS